MTKDERIRYDEALLLELGLRVWIALHNENRWRATIPAAMCDEPSALATQDELTSTLPYV